MTAATGARIWVLGARPRTLGASIAPVLVGAAATGRNAPLRLAAALAIGLCMQIGVNYLNDYFDGVRGVDTAQRVGPVRITASGLAHPRAVLAAALLSIAVAGSIGLALAITIDARLLFVGAAAIVGAFGYSGGPKPYASLALGEISVFTFFGLVATCGTAYVIAERIPAAAWWSAIPVGLLAVAILVANNLRDIATDTASGKRTLAVRLGDAGTRALYRITIIAAFAFVPLGIGFRALPLETLMTFGAVAVAAAPMRAVATARGPALIPVLLGTAKLQLAFGALLALGLWLR